MEILRTVLSLISLLIAALAFWISLRTYKASKKPVLRFSRREGPEWVLENSGKGIACNVHIAEIAWDSNEQWINYTRCYDIPADGKTKLSWVNAVEIGALYEDASRTKYATVCRNDINSMVEATSLEIKWPAKNSGAWKSEADRRPG